jgi:putative peptidoglycan lipid II flippase
VFERGAFTRETTLLTSAVLAAFALGLPAFVLTKIFTPAFYAREDMRTPLWFSIISADLNIAGSLVLFPRLGVTALRRPPVSRAGFRCFSLASYWFRAACSARRRQTIKRTVLIFVAAALMGGLLWWVEASFTQDLLRGHVLVRLRVGAALTDSVSIIVYFGLGAF